jgi:hypothetical protein
MPPMLETLQAVDKTFRARPHLNGQAVTAYVNARNFSVEFLPPNRAGDDKTEKPVRMPALGGVSAQALRYLDFLITQPVHAVLLHKGGAPAPAPERYAAHKLIVSVLRRHDINGAAKADKDTQQAGLLIEALTLNSRQADMGFAWMEAWGRGPRWRESLVAGRKHLPPEQGGLLSRKPVNTRRKICVTTASTSNTRTSRRRKL